MKKKLAIGIDIGGTRTKIGLVDTDAGIVIDTVISPTETSDESRFLDAIGSAVVKFKKNAYESGAIISGIGFGIPGFVFEQGTVDSTYGFLEFMEDYPLKEKIEQAYLLPCKADNDARVVALGEAIYGAGKDYSRVLVLTLGTGLGIGFTINGQLDGGLAYGHMGGHMTVTGEGGPCYCGKRGCLEALVSATGLVNDFDHEKWNSEFPELALNAEHIFGAAKANFEPARSAVNKLLGHLRTGVANYINIYAPDLVVLGGGVAKGLEHDLDKIYPSGLLSAYKNYQPKISISQLQEHAGILGAAALLNLPAYQSGNTKQTNIQL